ncbi:MAG: SRPBCC family protein [Chitinophagaceae bacterium]
MPTATTDTSNRELAISRLLHAPRELVWEAWTNPEHVKNWWGPNGFTNTIHEMEVKPGGVWLLTMHGPDGRDYPNKIIFLEVVKPERLVYRHSDEEGTEGVSFHTTVTFEKQGNKTLLTMKGVFDTAAELERVIREYGAKEGMDQTVSRLADYLTNLNP